MGLGDVAGVFSRYFVVGFFLPSFFGLVALSQSVTKAFLPQVYLDAGDGARILILGGAALLLGLVLSGLHYSILRLYEGYPLASRGDSWYAGWLYGHLKKREDARFEKARRAAEDDDAEPMTRRTAKWRLDLCFPWDNPALLLPTRFGNAIRAFERHAPTRWGLNSIAAWPHVELLMSSDEATALADGKGDVAFFINGSLVAIIAGLVMAADEIAHAPVDLVLAWLYLIPFVVSVAFYRAGVGAAIRWGSVVRASMDIHRREVYDKLGLRTPEDFTDERDTIAPAVNAALLRAEPIPDELAAARPEEDGDRPDGATLNLGRMSLRLEERRER